jgi:hypothetical protein
VPDNSITEIEERIALCVRLFKQVGDFETRLLISQMIADDEAQLKLVLDEAGEGA